MWVTMSRIPIWIFPLAFGLYFMGILANALRWYVLLRAQVVEIGYGEVLKIILAGNFASNFLPSTVGGDTVRMVSASRIASWTISLASVVVDRLLNVFVMMTLLPFSWISFNAVGGFEGVSGIGTELSLGVASPIFNKLWLRGKNWFKKIIDAFLVWRDRKDAIILGLILSWGARFFVFSAVLILARSLDIDVNLFQVIGVGAITYVLALLPISINGFGLREVTMTTLYVQLGASLEQASALVVLTRFILMVETLPGAIWISDALLAAQTFRKPGETHL